MCIRDSIYWGKNGRFWYNYPPISKPLFSLRLDCTKSLGQNRTHENRLFPRINRRSIHRPSNRCPLSDFNDFSNVISVASDGDIGPEDVVRGAIPQLIEKLSIRNISAKEIPEASFQKAVVEAGENLPAVCQVCRWHKEGPKQIGFLIGKKHDTVLEAIQFSIDPDFGALGVGTWVLNVLSETIKEHYSAIVLTTFRKVSWNEPFYKKNGFTVLAVSYTHLTLPTILLV